MDFSVVFSDPCRPVDLPGYANTVPPVQLPVFSDRLDDHSTAPTATS